jgi:hypothetical protein
MHRSSRSRRADRKSAPHFASENVYLVGNEDKVDFVFIVAVGVIVLFAALLALLELGNRLGTRAVALNPEATTGAGAMEGAVFALLGLLLAFTFSGAASRFDTRRSQIVEETNAIGTAYLRSDVLPPCGARAIAFRRYLDQRIEVYRALPDMLRQGRLRARERIAAADLGEVGRSSNGRREPAVPFKSCCPP